MICQILIWECPVTFGGGRTKEMSFCILIQSGSVGKGPAIIQALPEGVAHAARGRRVVVAIAWCVRAVYVVGNSKLSC